jgi:hypothetical protein
MTPHESRQQDARLHTLLWPEQQIYWANDGPRVHRWDGKRDTFDPLPEYWETWTGAGLVIDRMRELGWYVSIREWYSKKTLPVMALFKRRGQKEICGWGDTIPAAVAAAAEAALNAEKGEHDDTV